VITQDIIIIISFRSGIQLKIISKQLRRLLGNVFRLLYEKLRWGDPVCFQKLVDLIRRICTSCYCGCCIGSEGLGYVDLFRKDAIEFFIFSENMI